MIIQLKVHPHTLAIFEAMTEVATKKDFDKKLALGKINIADHVALFDGGFFKPQRGGADKRQFLFLMVQDNFTNEEIRAMNEPVLTINPLASDPGQPSMIPDDSTFKKRYQKKIDISLTGISADTLAKFRDKDNPMEPRHDKFYPKSIIINS